MLFTQTVLCVRVLSLSSMFIYIVLYNGIIPSDLKDGYKLEGLIL